MKRIYVLTCGAEYVEDVFVGVYDDTEKLKREMNGYDPNEIRVYIYDITENGTMIERGTAYCADALVLDDTVIVEL
jgi:hypothetical protein